MKQHHKCWQCGNKSKWEKHLYNISKRYHTTVHLCNNMKCHQEFDKNNKGKFTQIASYHDVN